MARFRGKIGFGVSTDIGDGVWVDTILEREYSGDITSNFRKYNEPEEQANPDLSLSSTVSIVADEYAIGHFHNIKYIMLEGTRWVINTVESKPPRLTLWLGRVYNGATPTD